MRLRNLGGPTWDIENIGGMAQQILIAEKARFSSIKKPLQLTDTSAVDPDDYVNITGTHTFTYANDGFVEIYNTRDMGEVKLEGVGERDGRASKGSVKIFYPGFEPAALGMFRMVKNMQLIVLIRLATGEYMQGGSELFPAEAHYSWSGAKNESGVRGSELMIDFFGPGAQNYLGTVPLAPAYGSNSSS